MKSRTSVAAILLVAVAGIARGETPARETPVHETSAPVPPRARAFLERHCLDCHSGDAPESGLNLATLSASLENPDLRRRWVQLYDRVLSEEMPPATAVRPDARSRADFLRELAGALTRADRATREIVLRRLNRSEYENTVRDLFGIYVDLQSHLPDDGVEQGFDTIGADLSVSAEQMVAYVEAADLVLDEVFGPAAAPRRIKKTVNIKDLRARTTADRVLPDGVVLFSGAKHLPLYGVSVPQPGLYRLRVEARAIQSSRPIVLQVNGGVTGRVPAHVAGFFAIPPGKGATIELTDRAVERGDTFSFGLVDGFPWWKVDGDEYKGAGVFVGDIEVEGPLEEWPRHSRLRLTGDVDFATGSLDEIRTLLKRKLPRAFRRSTDEADLAPFLALASQALEEGKGFEKALRRALKGILCAPEFLFLEERLAKRLPERPAERPAAADGSDQDDPSQNKQPIHDARVDDFALAARLSYFVWSSLPDAELLKLAERGELQKPEVRGAQLERLLADPKSTRFVERFVGQWLRLRDIDFTVPDRNLYPEYNQLLRQSMLDETHAFFREVLDRDLSVQNFIDSEFLMLNQPLAEFYGIRDLEGLEFRRVKRPEGSLRGGVMTQAGVLKVSADGTRTSPVLRGAWILKNFFGAPSPPPPPAVAAVEPDIRGASTVREQLAKHRDHESCNRCHRRIDPPGFALESFDVIGAQRDWYRTRRVGKYVKRPRHPQAPNHFVQYRQGPDVDASGKTADGESFTDIRAFKRLLLKDETALARSLTRSLLSYSLGRRLGFSDRPEVDRIVANTARKDYGLRSILDEIVRSEMFRRP